MTQTEIDLQELQERIRLAPGKLIGTRLRKARRASGISHDKVAAATGTSRSHLSKLERAMHRPGAPLLLALAREYDKPLDWFLVEDEDPNPFPDEAAA